MLYCYIITKITITIVIVITRYKILRYIARTVEHTVFEMYHLRSHVIARGSRGDAH